VDLKFPDYLTTEAKDLMTKLLVKEPKKRLPLAEVLTS
jgi:hypothetical protein